MKSMSSDRSFEAAPSRFRRHRWFLLGALVSALAVSSTVAIAAIPDGNTISACRDKDTGALRVIDKSAGERCKRSEAGLSWSSTTWRGNYRAGSAYRPGDIVSYNGSSYIATRTTSGVLPTNTTRWGLMAQRGATGARGPAGTGVGGDCAPFPMTGVDGNGSVICATTRILPIDFRGTLGGDQLVVQIPDTPSRLYLACRVAVTPGDLQGVSITIDKSTGSSPDLLTYAYTTRAFNGATETMVGDDALDAGSGYSFGRIDPSAGVGSNFVTGRFTYRTAGHLVTFDLNADATGTSGSPCSVTGTVTISTLQG